MGFYQVAPGLLVSSNIKVEIPHPDPCWVIENKDGTQVVAAGNGKLLLFSSEELLHSFVESAEIPEEICAHSYTWDELVDRHGESHPYGVIDAKPTSGFLRSVPLRKGI